MESVADVIKAYQNHACPEFLFFWGHTRPQDGRVTKACLSQWYECSFEVGGVTYHTAEQYMMAQKARLFGDTDTLCKIMKASTPREYKRLGHLIHNYDERIWEANRRAIVIAGNVHKFQQNKDLERFLQSTEDKILVEASPYDSIWGIGMSADAPGVDNPTKWRGMNLLGFALMMVRDTLE